MLDQPYSDEQREAILRRLEAMKEPVPPRQPWAVVVLRWMAVMPAACAAYYGAAVLHALISGLLVPNYLSRGMVFDKVINGIVATVACLWTGWRIAPCRKAATVLLLAILISLPNIALVFGWNPVPESAPYWLCALNGITSVLTAASMCVWANGKEPVGTPGPPVGWQARLKAQSDDYPDSFAA